MKACGEKIICCYPQTVDGPGWRNTVYWIIYRDENGDLQERDLQQDEQTGVLMDIADALESLHSVAIREATTKCAAPAVGHVSGERQNED
jgi:hypothetical protein